MNYEIVALKEKTVVGLTAKTKNSDETMGRVIGELWQRFFETGVYQEIPHKKNDRSIGLYSDYETDVNGTYCITVCCEVTEEENNLSATVVKKIPAGKYAKFIIYGDAKNSVANFWLKLWDMNLDRKYSGDFEEYYAGEDMKNMEIHLYIALNE